MGTVIETDGDFSGLPYGVLLPVPGASVWSVLGGSAEASVRNEADPDNPLVEVGTPSYAGAYVSVSGDSPTPDVLESSAIETADMTIFAVARKTGAGVTARIVTNLDAVDWATLYFSQTQAIFRLLAGATDESAVVTRTVTDWALLVARVENGVSIDLFDKTGGTENSTTMSTSREVVNEKNLRFGGAYQTAGISGSGLDMAFGAVYPEALTDGEIDETCEFIRTLMEVKGISV